MNNTGNRSNSKTECDIHLAVNGAVERTITENGTKKRVRRCDTCGELFRTIEETEDLRANEDRHRAEIMEGWHRKARESEEISEIVKMIFSALGRLKEQVRVAPGPEGVESEYP